MAKIENTEIAIADESVMNQIYAIRGQKVMLDRDLASLYGVETRILKQAVRRNIDRFPEDFMFEMTNEEFGQPIRRTTLKNIPKIHSGGSILMMSKKWNRRCLKYTFYRKLKSFRTGLEINNELVSTVNSINERFAIL